MTPQKSDAKIETSTAVSFADLDLLDQADDLILDAEVLLATMREMREHLANATLDHETRVDIRADLLELTERLHTLALTAL